MRAALLVGALCLGRVGPAFAQSGDDLPRGRLRQEDIAVRLDAGPVALRVVPVDDRLLVLLTAEAGGPLVALRAAHAESLEEAAARYGIGAPSVLLVTVFATADGVPFDPELLTIESRNRLFRPLDILPLSPLWHQRRIPQRETLSALYLFEEGIELFEPFLVEYGGVRSEDWARRLPRIERERARIQRGGPSHRVSVRPTARVRGRPGRTPAGRRATM